MSVLRYYDCITLCIRILGSLACNIFSLILDLCLVLCCDIYRSTLISIMYPACMITVHDRKSRALQHGMAAQIVHLEPDWLSEEILLRPEHYLQPNTAQRSARKARHDTMKDGPAGFQFTLTDAELDQRVSVQNVDGTASINESPGELA